MDENIKNGKTFGLNRVMEPLGRVPVSAWKLDNSYEISAFECRVALDVIYIEHDSFQQIYSECGDDDLKIRAKIMDIINKRGKLHNPFTDSGGTCHGVIDAMGTEYAKLSKHQICDTVLCNTSMAALPIHLDKIEYIDYNYGEIYVKGYAIIFINSPVTTIRDGLRTNYTMAIMDEAGALKNVCALAEAGIRSLIMGKDLISTVIYLNSIKQAVGGNCQQAVILDKSVVAGLPLDEILQILKEYAEDVFILDVSQPMSEMNKIQSHHYEAYDLTIICEDISGAEVFASLLTREGGKLYFTSLKNSYTDAILFLESLGKDMIPYALDQFTEGYEEFSMDAIEAAKDTLERIDALYKKSETNAKYSTKTKQIQLAKSGKIDDFTYASPVTQVLVEEALNIAGYDCSVIIQGETGTGKEKILSLIHKNSERKTKPCIKINCATIQENLAESEFFGYESGAFTGAQASGKEGYFDMANGGILFLDEIGTLSLGLQSKLLRVLQEGQFYRVGGKKSINIDVRVICANNISIKQLVEEGKFREDLYYRLNICTITVPPLRERKDDISALSKSFIAKYSARYGVDKELEMSAIARLMSHDWPGNVRELENLMHRTVINVKSHIITGEDMEELLNESVYDNLVLDMKHEMRKAEYLDFNSIIEEQEQRLINYALKKCGTTRKAADYLNMTQAQLMRKKQKYGL